jgi:ABC-2 type transport system ATP-binding protein
MTLITVKNLKKNYGDFQAVKGVSFAVKKGEVFGILGPNGAGKTTTLEIMEGLRELSSGSVMINDVDVAKDPYAVKEMIGVQLQSSSFFDKLTLVEILHLFSNLYSLNKDPKLLLEEVDLVEKSKNMVKELSGGQKQRLSIARAVLKNPPILILDEATSALDTESEKLVQEAIDRLMENRTVLVVAHRLSTIRKADRIVVLEKGRIVEEGSHDALMGKAGSYKKFYELQIHA